MGTRVSSSRGLIVYVPERDAAYESSVKYVHVLGGSGLATPEGEHRIVVTPVNDPPELVAAPLSTVEDMQAVEITLAAEDGDASFPGARTEYTIVRWPVLGELYQEGGGQPIEEVFRVPKVAQWAVRIPPYSVSWGPSFSSQYSMCSCCLIQQTCPHNCSCSVLSWHATQVRTSDHAANFLLPVTILSMSRSSAPRLRIVNGS